jgi:hypothetical protein
LISLDVGRGMRGRRCPLWEGLKGTDGVRRQ